MSRFILSALAALSTAANAPKPAPISPAICETTELPFKVPGSAATDAELVEYIDLKAALHCLNARTVDTMFCRCWARGWYPDGL